MLRQWTAFLFGIIGLLILGSMDGFWDSLGAGILVFAHQIEKH